MPISIGPVLAALALQLPAAAAPARDSVVAITHVTVVDGTGAAPRSDQTVLVRGRRIADVGPAARVVVPAGARVVAGRGKHLIPGLWDMHVHAFHEASANGLALAHGVTGMRDMGDLLAPLEAWRRQVRTGALVGPRVVYAGAILDGDPPLPWRPFNVQVTDSAGAARTVDSLAARGVDFIKTYSTLDTAVLRHVVAAARRRGLTTSGHLPAGMTPAWGARAGLRTQEHLYGFLQAASARGRELGDSLRAILRARPSPFAVYQAMDRQSAILLDSFDPARAEAEYAALRAAGAAVVPTLAVLEYPSRLDDSAFVHDPALRGIPAVMRARATSVASVREAGRGRDAAFERRLFEAHLRTVRGLHRAGVTLLVGTDAPNPFTAPGDAIHRELALFVRAGLTPMQAIEAATRVPARFLGMADSLGTVERGKLADLVLLDGDPLADIANTRRVHAVLADGALVDSTARAQLLDAALRAADAMTTYGGPAPAPAAAPPRTP
jgi:cytosine/adenosine deaminase-related metal-dependent hydrolase